MVVQNNVFFFEPKLNPSVCFCYDFYPCVIFGEIPNRRHKIKLFLQMLPNTSKASNFFWINQRMEEGAVIEIWLIKGPVP